MIESEGNLDPNMVAKRTEKNVRYLQQTLVILPPVVISLDSSKILLAYFGITGLDVLDKIDKLPHKKENLINWIYKHQIVENIDHSNSSGFRGSSTLVTEKNKSIQNHHYDCSHVTMTFSALNSLISLGDDLSRINKKSIISSLKNLQLPDGSFTATNQDYENDVRFLYSACCICYILNDWSGMDKEKAFDFLKNCMTYEGAFGQNPEAEAHGGSTFCAVASLYLMGYLNRLSENQLERLKYWCINRQTSGFNGRVNKPWDTCYSFWVGSTLKILDTLQYSSYQENIDYIFETFNSIIGGFAKWPDCHPDPLHTFMGLCGLSLVNYPGLQPIHPALVITQRAYDHLKRIHKLWESQN